MRSPGYVWKRCLFAVVTIFISLTLNFFLFRVLPGSAFAGVSRVPNASPELKHLLEVQFGLDQPIWQQYLLYLKELFQGNLGISYADQQPVAEKLREAFVNTVPMVAIGTALAILIGIALGVLTAVRRGTPTDHVITNVSVLFYAFPTQFLGMMLLVFTAGLLPSAGMTEVFSTDTSFTGHLLDVGKHMILPVATLVLTLYAEYTLIVRSALLETLGEDYVLTARAKGLSKRRIVRSYAMRNAMLPTITLVALSLGTIVTGSILIEVIFSWPGIGRSLYEAVLARDYPMLQGGFLVITGTVILLNLAADLLYFRLDPRITT